MPRRTTKYDVFLAILSWIDPALAPNGMHVEGDKLTTTHVEAALADFYRNPHRLAEVASYYRDPERDGGHPGYFTKAHETLARLYPSLKHVGTNDPVVSVDVFSLVTSETSSAGHVVALDSTDADVKRLAACDLLVEAYRGAPPAVVADDFNALAARLFADPDVALRRACVVGYYGSEMLGEHLATACEALGIKKGDPVEFLIRKVTT